MNSTHLSITDASSKKLVDILENVPENQRDGIWHQLYSDIKRIRSIWNNVGAKKIRFANLNKSSVSKAK